MGELAAVVVQGSKIETWFDASAMFILIAAHWTRVYLTGSYKFPREVSWMSGVLLAGAVVVMGYTGQLLRWDQNGVWSTVIAAEQAGRVPWFGVWLARFILGRDSVNSVTLSRYFAIHVFFVPAAIFLLLGMHLYLVIKQGISEPPKAGHPVDPKTYRAWYETLLKRSGRPFFPDAMWRDVVFGTMLVVGSRYPGLAIRPAGFVKTTRPYHHSRRAAARLLSALVLRCARDASEIHGDLHDCGRAACCIPGVVLHAGSLEQGRAQRKASPMDHHRHHLHVFFDLLVLV